MRILSPEIRAVALLEARLAPPCASSERPPSFELRRKIRLAERITPSGNPVLAVPSSSPSDTSTAADGESSDWIGSLVRDAVDDAQPAHAHDSSRTKATRSAVLFPNDRNNVFVSIFRSVSSVIPILPTEPRFVACATGTPRKPLESKFCTKTTRSQEKRRFLRLREMECWNHGMVEVCAPIPASHAEYLSAEPPAGRTDTGRVPSLCW